MTTEQPDRIVEGSSAPDFILESNTGDQVNLAKFRGRAHVVLFFVREYV
jgi:peroxiredoxin